MKLKKRIFSFTKKLVIVVCSVLISVFIAEIAFRSLLFSDLAIGNSLRRPELYSDFWFSDDYWKLRYVWNKYLPLWKQKYYHPPSRKIIHPLLGWVNDNFSSENFLHNKVKELNGRRPVLLYGDSFAECVDIQCFQDILNKDEEFGKTNFLLNYGVGGYGVDQIYLLFQKTLNLYNNPFVVFSFMTDDLDRSNLSVREGQKPYFEIVNGELRLQGVPINPNPDDFFKKNPPLIKSYLWNKFLYLKRNMLVNLRAYLRDDVKKRNKMITLNEMILSKAVMELTKRNTDFVFLIFHPQYSLEDKSDPWAESWRKDMDWRSVYINPSCYL